MRKLSRVVYAILFIILLVAITPWIDGMLFKQHFLNLITTFNNTHTQTEIRVLNYQVGWLKSHAEMMVKPKQLPAGAPSYDVELTEDITHGPIIHDPVRKSWDILYARLDGRLSVESLEALLGLPAKQGLMQFTTQATFGDTYISEIKMPPITKEITPGNKINWQGMTGTGTMHVTNGNIDHVAGQMNMGSTIVQATDFSATLNSWTAQGDRKNTNFPGLWNGKSTSFMPSFSATLPDKQNIGFESLNMSATYGVDQNTFYNTLVNISLNKFMLPNDFTITPSTFKLSLIHLDAPSLSTLIMHPSNDPNESAKTLQGLIIPGTEMKADVEINTSKGHFVNSTDISWKDKITPGHPEEFYNKTNLKMNMRVAVELVDYIIALMDQTNIPLPKQDPKTTAMNTISTTPIDANTIRTEKVNELVKEGKLTPDAAKKVLDLQNINLSPEGYVYGIDQLTKSKEIPDDVATDLKKIYTTSDADTTKAAIAAAQASQLAQTEETTTPVKEQDTTETNNTKTAQPGKQLKQQIDTWMQQGYMTIDKGDYVTEILGSDGKLTVNGKQVELPAPPPTPTNQPSNDTAQLKKHIIKSNNTA